MVAKTEIPPSIAGNTISSAILGPYLKLEDLTKIFSGAEAAKSGELRLRERRAPFGTANLML
jgi:hypothetical protein